MSAVPTYGAGVNRPLLAILLLTATLAGCSSSSTTHRAVPAPTSTPTAPATTKPPTAKPRPAPVDPFAGVDPLTGAGPKRTGPVVAIKVDNEGLARPYQRGLDRAAIVYQELMEGGSTRLLAVFDDQSTGEVGPIRSVRESDIDLLREFGQAAVGFSGGNRGVKDSFHRAERSGWVLDASYDVLPGAYRIGEHRADANNFFSSPGALAVARPRASAPRDIGLRFAGVPTKGPATGAATADYSADSSVRVVYDGRTRTYAVYQDGRLMQGVAPNNVVVQFVTERPSRYVDVLGNGTPYTVTTGGGRAVVLRDGMRVESRWLRQGFGRTRLVTTGRRDVPLRPGRTWVLLLPAGRPLTFT